MDWQQVVSLTMVSATAVLFVWNRLRRRKHKLQQLTQCGCNSPGHSGLKSSIVFHARKGEAPRITVKL